MNKYSPIKTAGGGTLQAGIPFRSAPDGEGAARLVRGVVVATYVVDDPNHPYAGRNPVAIYCDVLAYTALTGGRVYPIARCLVSQEGASQQGGAIWKPRAAAQNLAGGVFGDALLPDPTQMDGDHVVVGFLDDLATQPVVLRALPHPYADVGQGNAAIGARTRLRVADGDPHFFAHHGVFWGASDGGDAVIDASGGYSGAQLPGGARAPQVPGQGNVRSTSAAAAAHTRQVGAAPAALATETLDAAGLRLQFAGPAALAVAGAAGPLFAAAGGGAAASLSIGGGSGAAADAAKVLAALQALVAYIDAHVHISASPGAPTSPPTVPAPAAASPASVAAKGLGLPT